MRILFFIAGFALSALTQRRIDSFLSIAQQVLFLSLGYFILACRFGEDTGRLKIPRRFHRAWAWSDFAFQFITGSLLSKYTYFFFRSSSVGTSFVFMAILALVMIFNEFVSREKFKVWMRSLILSVCLCCFSIATVPIAVGKIGPRAFLISISAALVAFLFVHLIVSLVLRPPKGTMGSQWRVPHFAVTVALLALYFLKIIPPIPLSIQNIGIYHGVEQNGDVFKVTYFRPWWKVWEAGDQNFERTPDEKIFCFFSVFSPVHFADQIYVKWALRHPHDVWETTDRIPVSISGGRGTGWRGYTYKNRYVDGNWRITIETEDERELGRVYFKVSSNPAADRRKAKSSNK